MFTEIVKLVPVMDQAQLNRMFSDLTKRFGTVAKKFGEGMKGAFKFGGVIGLVAAVVGKLTNPLERAEELFHKITNQGDDAVTNGKEFGTDPGKLLLLQAAAASRGLDADTLRTLLGKFQGKLAAEQEAAALPGRLQGKLDNEKDPIQRKILEAQLMQAKAAAAEGGTLHQYIGMKDIGEAFFQFTQNLGRLDPARRTVAAGDVFGDKLRGKTSEFVATTPEEWAAFFKRTPSAEQLGKDAIKTGEISDYVDANTAVRSIWDFHKKAQLVSFKQADDIDAAERHKDTKDDETLKRFDALKTASIATQELTDKFDKFVTDLTVNILPPIVEGVKAISKFLPSVTETKEAVTGVVDPILKYAADFTQQGSDGNLQIQQDIRDIKNWLNQTWAEFRVSRIYTIFGGKP